MKYENVESYQNICTIVLLFRPITAKFYILLVSRKTHLKINGIAQISSLIQCVFLYTKKYVVILGISLLNYIDFTKL